MYNFDFVNGSTKCTKTELVILEELSKVFTDGFRKEFNIQNFYDSGVFRNDVIQKSLSTYLTHIMYSKKFSSVDEKHKEIQYLGTSMMECYKNIYSRLVSLGTTSMTGLSIHQMMSLQDTPKLAKVLKSLRTAKGERFNKIEKVYGVLDETVINQERGSSNTIQMSYLGGLSSKSQFRQMYGAVGYVANLDNEISKTPLTQSFVSGLNTTAQLALSVKASMIAVHHTVGPIRVAEYYSRRLQTAAANVKWVYTQDCGNVDGFTITNYVNNDTIDGMWYKVNQEDEWTEASPTNRPKEGCDVIIRNICHCRTPENGVCIYCAGSMAYRKPKNHSYGLWLISKQTNKVVQDNLSIKHYLSSAVPADIEIDEGPLYVENSKVYIKDGVSIIKFPIKDKGFTFTNVLDSVDLDGVRISSLSSINRVQDVSDGKKKGDKSIITQNGNMSKQFLLYLKERPEAISNDRSNHIIDVSKFDNRLPFLTFIKKGLNLKTYGDAVRRLITSKKFNGKDITKEERFDLLVKSTEPTLKINYSALALIIHSLSIDMEEDGDILDSRNLPSGDVEGLDKFLASTNTFDRMCIGSNVTPILPHLSIKASNSNNSISFISSYEDSMKLLSRGYL